MRYHLRWENCSLRAKDKGIVYKGRVIVNKGRGIVYKDKVNVYKGRGIVFKGRVIVYKNKGIVRRARGYCLREQSHYLTKQ